MLKNEVFTVDVNNENYQIEPICEPNNNCIKFKVSTNCDYMFTLNLIDNGSWEMEKDVTVMYPELIEQIGQAIEKHEA